MTTTQGAEMSVTVNISPIQDYSSCMFTLQAIMLHLLINDSWIQTFYSFISNCHTIKWLFNDNQISGLWCYNCLLTFGHLSRYDLCTIIIMKMKALFLARSHLVRGSLLSELLN